MSVFNQLKNFIRTGGRGSDESQEAKKYEAVARIVEEERVAKQRLPKYEGLDRYKLLKKMGDGAFSNVYKALDMETQEKVAVKAVRKYELKPQQRASVLKEVQIMRTLKHPSIIELKGFIETKEYYFLILELCDGGELFHQIVRLTYFSEDLARHCIRQVAEGIRYLHEEKGIVHRDIKPENLLFNSIPFMERKTPAPSTQPGDEDKEDEGEFVEGLGGGTIGQVKIADLGLSKQIWDMHTMTPCGTVGYTAPEIVKDERYSKSVDMWALGCVLYTMLCGFPPFYDESIQVLTEKVARGQYTFLSPWWDPISDEAKDLVSHLLCINPNERYTINQFLKHPWMQTSPGSKATTPRESRTVRNTAESSGFDGVHQPMHPMVEMLDKESPAKERRKDIFSGLSSMKEIFDVSYAVHRMAEERARRKELRRRQRREPGRVPPPNALNNFYDEDDDDEDDDDEDDDMDYNADDTETDDTNGSSDASDSRSTSDSDIETARSRLSKATLNQNTPGNLIQQRQRDRIGQKLRAEVAEAKAKKRAPKPVFELNMDKATLLGRRKHQVADANTQ